MAYIYNNIWKIIKDCGMTVKELRNRAGLTENDIDKLRENKTVNMNVLFKIRDVLNCSLDDIITNVSGNIVQLLPDTDLLSCDIEISSQLSIIRLTNLKDLPYPHTVNDIRRVLSNYYQQNKLSLEACRYVINKLSEAGMEVSLFPDICPQEKFLPKTITYNDEWEEDSPQEKRYYGYVNKVENYMRYKFGKLLDLDTEIIGKFGFINRSDSEIIKLINTHTNCVLNEKKALIEYGFIHAKNMYKGTAYSTKYQCLKNSYESYPFNLLFDIMFRKESMFCLTDIKDDVLSMIDIGLKRCTKLERLIIKLIYQYGLSEDSIISITDLPNYKSIKHCISEIRKNAVLKFRRLRGPAGIHSRQWELESPYSYNNASLYLYKEWVENRKEKIKETQKKQPLFQCLSNYYDITTLKILFETSDKWSPLVETSVESMGFNWKIKYALKAANISTVNGLWTLHGITVPLSDIQNSGLSKLGIDVNMVADILEKMKSYYISNLSDNEIDEVVRIAEYYSNGEKKVPDIARNCIPSKILVDLLNLGYRSIDKLTLHYQTGVLERFLNEKLNNPNDIEVILEPIIRIVKNEHNALLFFNDLTQYNNNYGKSQLANVRENYLNGNLLFDGEYDELPISKLYPREQLDIELLVSTRTGKLEWKAIGEYDYTLLNPISNLLSSDKKHFCGYYVERYNVWNTTWIIAKDNLAANGNIYLFAKEELHDEAIWSQVQVDERIIKLLYNDIEYTVEIKRKFLKIDDMELSVRSYNCLKRADINTLDDILKLTNDDLIQVKNLGKKGHEELIRKVQSLGYSDWPKEE